MKNLDRRYLAATLALCIMIYVQAFLILPEIPSPGMTRILFVLDGVAISLTDYYYKKQR